MKSSFIKWGFKRFVGVVFHQSEAERVRHQGRADRRRLAACVRAEELTWKSNFQWRMMMSKEKQRETRGVDGAESYMSATGAWKGEVFGDVTMGTSGLLFIRLSHTLRTRDKQRRTRSFSLPSWQVRQPVTAHRDGDVCFKRARQTVECGLSASHCCGNRGN